MDVHFHPPHTTRNRVPAMQLVPKCICSYQIQYGRNNSREVCHSFEILDPTMKRWGVCICMLDHPSVFFRHSMTIVVYQWHHLQLSWAYGKAGYAWNSNGNWKRDINHKCPTHSSHNSSSVCDNCPNHLS